MEINQLKILSFPQFHIDYLISKTALSFIFLSYLAIYIVVSIVLLYHWKTYGMRSAGVLLGRSLFLIVSLCLFVICFLAIYYF